MSSPPEGTDLVDEVVHTPKCFSPLSVSLSHPNFSPKGLWETNSRSSERETSGAPPERGLPEIRESSRRGSEPEGLRAACTCVSEPSGIFHSCLPGPFPRHNCQMSKLNLFGNEVAVLYSREDNPWIGAAPHLTGNNDSSQGIVGNGGLYRARGAATGNGNRAGFVWRSGFPFTRLAGPLSY